MFVYDYNIAQPDMVFLIYDICTIYDLSEHELYT